MFRALILSVLPALLILAFRTLCTLKPAPAPKYLEKRTPAPAPWAPGDRC